MNYRTERTRLRFSPSKIGASKNLWPGVSVELKPDGDYSASGAMTPESELEDASRTRPAMAQDVLEYEKMVQQSAATGQLLTAIEVARDGLSRFGGGKTLQQQLALALAQTGALDAARKVLDAEGVTYTDRFGAPRARPEVGIERDSRLAFLRALRELGLDLEAPEAPRPPAVRGGYYAAET